MQCSVSIPVPPIAFLPLEQAYRSIWNWTRTLSACLSAGKICVLTCDTYVHLVERKKKSIKAVRSSQPSSFGSNETEKGKKGTSYRHRNRRFFRFSDFLAVSWSEPVDRRCRFHHWQRRATPPLPVPILSPLLSARTSCPPCRCRIASDVG